MKKLMPWTLATTILASGLMLSSPAQADEYHYNENYELVHNETGKVTAVSDVDGYLYLDGKPAKGFNLLGNFLFVDGERATEDYPTLYNGVFYQSGTAIPKDDIFVYKDKFYRNNKLVPKNEYIMYDKMREEGMQLYRNNQLVKGFKFYTDEYKRTFLFKDGNLHTGVYKKNWYTVGWLRLKQKDASPYDAAIRDITYSDDKKTITYDIYHSTVNMKTAKFSINKGAKIVKTENKTKHLGTDEWDEYVSVTITNVKRNMVYSLKVTNFQQGFTFNTKVSGWSDKMDHAKYLNEYMTLYELYKDKSHAERDELLQNKDVLKIYKAAEKIRYKQTKSANAFMKVSAAKRFYEIMKPIEYEE